VRKSKSEHHSSASRLIVRIKQTDASKLQDEYEKLVSGLQAANDDDEIREEDDMLANPGE
jgi:DNA excision repair protein ERCC-2